MAALIVGLKRRVRFSPIDGLPAWFEPATGCHWFRWRGLHWLAARVTPTTLIVEDIAHVEFCSTVYVYDPRRASFS